MNEEEKTYKKLLDDLKNLPKVDAPKNFETELLRKINSSTSEKKENFWNKLLSPRKLAPAAIAIASAAIIFFVVDINSEEMEDPLNIAPRLREDFTVIEAFDETPVAIEKKSELEKEKGRAKVLIKDNYDTKKVAIPETKSNSIEFDAERESEGLQGGELNGEISKADSFEREMKRERNDIINLPVVQSSSDQINKDNINFMQRNLSTEEKKEVQQLKMKVQTEKSAKTQQNSNKLP